MGLIRVLLGVVLFFMSASSVNAACWKLRSGVIVTTTSVSTTPARGARIVPCPVEGAKPPSNNTTKPVDNGNVIITLRPRFTAFDQLAANDTNLYSSSDWANADETVEGSPRVNWTCLSTVYAMIEHARGNTSYRVGPGTYIDAKDGAQKISGVRSGAAANIEPPSFSDIQSELRKGNPVVLRGNSRRLGVGHYMLAIGVDKNGSIITLDPYGGKKIIVDPKSWRAEGSQAGSLTVISYRKVAF